MTDRGRRAIMTAEGYPCGDARKSETERRTVTVMKKLFACIALCALLLSLGTVFAAAEDLPPVTWTEGSYTYGDADDFEPLGDVIIVWDPIITQKVDLTDGDLGDWYTAEINGRVVTQKNMISWVNEGSGVPTDWKMTMFAAADPDCLYLAFEVVDANFAYATDAATYNGDAIQLALDFGGLLKEKLEEEPDILSNHHSIFYSFAGLSDGAPLQIMRQESDQDTLLSEANGDDVKGAARKTEDGWSVELALSWQLLCDDYCWKAWEENLRIYVGSDEALPLKLGLCLSYLNRAETGGEITWAAATAKGYTNADGAPLVSWTPFDNGGTLILPWEDGMHVNCTGVTVLTDCGTVVPQTDPPETETPYDDPIIVETELNTSVEWYETIPPEVEETLRDAAEDLDAEDELNAILEKYGCTAAVGTGSLTALLTVAAAAYALKKK